MEILKDKLVKVIIDLIGLIIVRILYMDEMIGLI